MRLSLDANVSSNATAAGTAAPSLFPPLPHVPEPAIFDPSYAATLVTVFNDSSFPPKTPVQKIYYTRLKVVEAILASRKESAQSVSINLLAAWVSIVLLCAFLLVRIRRNRQRALLGDADAARKIILPAFEPLLWALGGVNLLLIISFGVLLVAGDVGAYYNRVTIELAISVKLMNGLFVITYMLQPSLSLRALRRAMYATLWLSGYTIPVVLVLNRLATPDNQRLCYWVQMASRFLLVVYMGWLIMYPPARASVRSFRILCVYVIGMNLMLCSMSEAYHRGGTKAAEAIGWAIAVYSMLLPICLWNVLRADTEHWRGIGKRAVELQDTFRRKKGKIQERVSSQGLHLLIEMYRKFIIDFARLEFYEPIANVGDVKNKATVYRGFLHTKKEPVAIKVYMPADVTEATVAEFSHEAALCGALVHPNILRFHGLCVCPPNICLVTELCEGTLCDVLETHGSRLRRGHAMPTRRQQTLIDIGYMIDAARALAYLHSFTPPFVHRDIRPGSFLVDDKGTVKLTDFGASRTLSARSTRGHRHQDGIAAIYPHTANGSSRTSLGPTVLAMPSGGGSLTNRPAQYLAPELVTGRRVGGGFMYGEAADVFSLAMTMWSILHPGEEMYSTLDHVPDSEIFERVFAGHRPFLDPLLHTGLRGIITDAWHTDPRMRPSMQALVESLEAIQGEVAAAFAHELMDELSVQVRAASVRTGDEQSSFAGTHAVETMRSSAFVDSPREAIRLGNMLMDCGFLHHAKHARSFEYAASQYVFDVDSIVARQPLTLLESDGDMPCGRDEANGRGEYSAQHSKPDDRSSVSSSLGYAGSHEPVDARSSHVLMEHRCACRKLAQRMETERTTRRWFLRKLKVFSDENLVTANLLADDQLPTDATGDGDFAAFGESSDYRAG